MPSLTCTLFVNLDNEAQVTAFLQKCGVRVVQREGFFPSPSEVAFATQLRGLNVILPELRSLRKRSRKGGRSLVKGRRG